MSLICIKRVKKMELLKKTLEVIEKISDMQKYSKYYSYLSKTNTYLFIRLLNKQIKFFLIYNASSLAVELLTKGTKLAVK